MAGRQKRTHETKHKAGFLLGCFGFSGNAISRKKPLKNTQSDSKPKTRCFSWSRFRIRNTDTKTVPVDATAERTKPSKQGRTSKSTLTHKADKIPSNPPTSQKTQHNIPAVATAASDQDSKEIRQETKHGHARNIILEKRKNTNHLGSTKDDNCHKGSTFLQKIDAIRSGSSHPGSPDVAPRPKRTRTAFLTHTISLPAPNREYPVGCRSRIVTLKRLRQEKKGSAVEELDPIAGLSIIIVTLLIMLVWGRLCAVLCTCAWCYCVPGLRRTKKKADGVFNNGLNSGGTDLNSEQYKRKVVLEGFLERNRHF